MAPPRRVRKMRRAAPAMRIRETRARAGPVYDVRSGIPGKMREGMRTRCHCVSVGMKVWRASSDQLSAIDCAVHGHMIYPRPTRNAFSIVD